jgi:hypothetical protein
MRSVADQSIAETVAARIQCDPAYVTVRRTVSERDGQLRERVEVIVSSWAVLLHDSPPAVVTAAINEALHGTP